MQVLASGSVRQLDPSESAKRPINVFFYSLLNGIGEEIYHSQIESLIHIKKLGMRTEQNYKKINSFDIKYRYKTSKTIQ